MKDIFSSSWQYILAGSIMLLIVKNIAIFMNSNFLSTSILILIGMIAYFLILILLKNKLILELIKSIKEKLVKIKNKAN